MEISLVVAASENNIIGKNNQLVWHLPNDMKFFKNVTWGLPVIMGRKTFEALGKPLPGRINIVITRQADWQAAGAIIATELNDAIKKAAETNCKVACIIGGGEIYKQAISLADIIYITRVHANLEGDTSFPVINQEEWQMLYSEDFEKDEKHQYSYSFQKWRRI